MSTPAYLTQPQIHRIPVVLKEVRAGRWKVPRFQRPFVWTPQQRLELFESIYDAQPIGSILLWRTRDHALKCYGWRGAHVIQPDAQPESGEAHEYVLDGHQRLTTLYHALALGLLDEGEDPSRDTQGEEPEGGPIYFDLENKTFELWRRRGEPLPTWLPLSIVLDPYALDEFRQRLPTSSKRRDWYNRAEALASRLKDYAVPAIPLVTEDMERAAQSFMRVNRSGEPVTEAQLLNAVTWSNDFDLNAQLEDVRTDLADIGWHELSDDLILKAVKAMLGLDIYKASVGMISEELKKAPEALSEVSDRLRSAASFLAKRGIYGTSTLPYSFQLVLLTDALGAPDQRSTSQKTRLAAWFWATTFGGYFAGMSTTGVRRAHEFIVSQVVNGQKKIPEDIDQPITPVDRFDFRAARSRALALLLARGTIKDHDRTRKLRRLLARRGNDAIPKLYSKRKLGGHPLHESVANRVIVEPARLKRVRDQLTSGTASDELLDRHMIDETAADLLAKGDLTGFLEARLEAIEDIERQRVERLGLTYVRREREFGT